jgi:hypothetical protein
MVLSLQQSKLDVRSSPLSAPIAERRLLSAVAVNVSSLIAFFEALRLEDIPTADTRESNPPTIVALECMTSLMLSMKVSDAVRRIYGIIRVDV